MSLVSAISGLETGQVSILRVSVPVSVFLSPFLAAFPAGLVLTACYFYMLKPCLIAGPNFVRL